jgi:hypothetical protein
VQGSGNLLVVAIRRAGVGARLVARRMGPMAVSARSPSWRGRGLYMSYYAAPPPGLDRGDAVAPTWWRASAAAWPPRLETHI